MSSSSDINYRELETNNFVGFSLEDYCDLLQVYLSALPVTVATLEQACAREDAGLAARTVHKLKSNTSYVCFSDLPARCEEVEQRLKAESIADVRGAAEDIGRRCSTLLDEIRRFLEA